LFEKKTKINEIDAGDGPFLKDHKEKTIRLKRKGWHNTF